MDARLDLLPVADTPFGPGWTRPARAPAPRAPASTAIGRDGPRPGEPLGALSHALDMTEGQPAGHCLRSCWIGQQLGRASTVFQQIATNSVSAGIRGLPTPTLIVWGDEDRALSVGTVTVLKSLLPNAQAIVMPHVGHAPMIERPQQTAEDYLHFRATLQGPGL